MTDEVKFTDEQWDKVAEAADIYAQALEDQRGFLRDVLTKNWAGDCGEGAGTIENLRHLLNRGGSESFSGVVNSEAEYFRLLANQCRNAKATLSYGDSRNGSQFRNAE